jgi:hypothetical protein
MRASPKQAWPHGADPCLGTGFRQRVTTAVAREEMFFSRERPGACEAPRAVSEGSSAVPNRLASLKSKTGGIIPPRSPIRNLRICSNFFSRDLSHGSQSNIPLMTRRSAADESLHDGLMLIFHRTISDASAVTTVTLTHLADRPYRCAPMSVLPTPGPDRRRALSQHRRRLR